MVPSSSMAAIAALFSLLISSASGTCTKDSCCSLYSPIYGKELVMLRDQDIFAWDRESSWKPLNEIDGSLVPITHGDISIEFFVRFEPSPDTSNYEAVLFINNAPSDESASFFDIRVQYPTRNLVFQWRGQDKIIGRTRLESKVWHHVVASYSSNGGCAWCGRLSLYVNGALDHVWGYVENANSVRPKLMKPSMLHGHPGERVENAKHVPVWDAEFASMTDVRIWCDELSLDEVRSLASQGPELHAHPIYALPTPSKPIVYAPTRGGASLTPPVKRGKHKSSLQVVSNPFLANSNNSRVATSQPSYTLPLVWHSMNISDESNLFQSHITDDVDSLIRISSPIVDFGESLHYYRNEDDHFVKDIEYSVQKTEKVKKSNKIDGSTHQVKNETKKLKKKTTVSLIVWVEDGDDELRQDVGQVENLWRSLQGGTFSKEGGGRVDMFKPLFDTDGDKWENDHGYNQKMKRKRMKLKHQSVSGGLGKKAAPHVSSLHPKFSTYNQNSDDNDNDNERNDALDDLADDDTVRYTRRHHEAVNDDRRIYAEFIVVTSSSDPNKRSNLERRLAALDQNKISLSVLGTNDDSSSFSEIANWAAMFSSGDYLVFLKPNIIPLNGWLYELLHAHHKTRKVSPSSTSSSLSKKATTSKRFDGGIVGSVVLYPSGKVFSSGYEYFDTPIMNPSETKSLNEAADRGHNHHRRCHCEANSTQDAITSTTGINCCSSSITKSESGVILPHHKLRGYHARDMRISPPTPPEQQNENLRKGKGNDKSGGSYKSGDDLVTSLGVSRHCMLLSRSTFFDLHGFDIGYTSGYEDADLALRLLMKHDQLDSPNLFFPSQVVKDTSSSDPSLALEHHGLVVTAARSRVVSMNPEGYPELDNSYASQLFEFRFSHNREGVFRSRLRFAEEWGKTLASLILTQRLTSAKFSWIVHCGGSQGYEAASILLGLEPLAATRMIVRRYRECEHTDTITGTPGAFRDAFDRSAMRRFSQPYQPPMIKKAPAFLNLSHSEKVNNVRVDKSENFYRRNLLSSGNDGSSQKVSVSVDGDLSHDSAMAAALANNLFEKRKSMLLNEKLKLLSKEYNSSKETRMISEEWEGNKQGAGSIVLYARDYRELGRWVPRDASYVIGRYMFEAQTLPEAWTHHCNQLDEIWVPSHWQKETFIASGVEASKIQVLPEALDVYQYDPSDLVTKPLALTGTVLDGVGLQDPNRPFVFLSVFKMEDRKGWRELVKAYMLEFEGSMDETTGKDRVILLLRTYVHVEGKGFVQSKEKVMFKITRYLSKTIGYHPESSRKWPKIEVVEEHLPASEMPNLYKSADCFVLPTHGEGWGLPTMEAMAMGLPTITTDWGGSTEFVTSEVAYPVVIDGVVSSQQTLDSPYRGNHWAKTNAKDLRNKMRSVFNDLTDATTGVVVRGRKGRGMRFASLPSSPSDVRQQDGSADSFDMKQWQQEADSFEAVRKGRAARHHIMNKFSPHKVATTYAKRLEEIQQKVDASNANLNVDIDSSGVNEDNIKAKEEEYHADKILQRIDSSWQLSESYSTCVSTTGKPFSLSSLPPNHPAKSSVYSAPLLSHPGGNLCKVAIISTYSPRECGIAIYSERLVEALQEVCGEERAQIEVIPVKHKDMDIDEYDRSIVKIAINEWELEQYEEAARYINREGFGLVLLQYEFGIWPVAHVLCFANMLQTRLITTVHTVARTYAMEEYHAYIVELAAISHKITVMTELMRWTLESFHGIPGHKIAVIPHGVPDRALSRNQGTRRQKNFHKRKIIMTNGLIHGYKGIEYMIEAMPKVLKKHPDAIYLIEGKPHPGGWGVQGYYSMLKQKANELGLNGNAIIFNNVFSDFSDLLQKLDDAYIYVNPYTDHTQSVSGTVAMALSTGSAIVSTPYPYAIENLNNGIGVFVPFRDSNKLADAIVDLLDKPAEVVKHNFAAHSYAQNMTWPKVAQMHLDLARSLD